MAPVNAPLRCPNRWLSSISRGTAEQTSTPKFLPARGDGIVDFAGDDFLPGAGLAGDQDRQIGWANASRHRVDLTHPRGNEQVALEHQPLFDRPERGAVPLLAL